MALALLPPTIIEDTYDKLLLTMTTHLRMTLSSLLNYFQEQWFQKVPISQWCIHGLNMRTNNNAEGKQNLFSPKSSSSCFFSIS